MNDTDLNKQKSARFQTGVSGNPAGRPRGLPDRRTEMRKLLQPHAQALVDAAVRVALAGDVGALRLCLERLIPRIKNETLAIDFHNADFTQPQQLPLAVGQVLNALASQQITPEQAKIVCDIIATQCKLLEIADLATRIDSIEHALKIRG